MSSIEEEGCLGAEERGALLDVAARSIEQGLTSGAPLALDPQDYPTQLREMRATFVTLEIGQQLRGCIGVLTAVRPLVQDVAANAFAAAFEDPRFPRLTAAEFPRLTIHLSVLSLPETLHATSEADLLRRIRPGIDGLILQDRGRHGTFLPSVWEQLPSPVRFLEHLRRKAGLPTGYWSETLEVSRYTTESFGAEVTAILSGPDPRGRTHSHRR